MIGIYAHHHGSGHLQRALSVAAVLRDEVTILTSATVDRRSVPDPERVRVLPLPMDHDGPGALAPAHLPDATAESGVSGATGPGDGQAGVGDDPTAGGRLHWAPLHQPGLRRRMALIADWIDRTRPAVLWTDISVEVTLAARLTGTPVVSTVLPGRRDDGPHVLAHGVCSALVAGWPRSAGAPVPAGAARPLVPVGGVSRFADRDPDVFRGQRAVPDSGTGDRATASPQGRPRILHLRGSGGEHADTRWDAVRDHITDVDWVSLGGPGGRWVADPWDEMCRADVVVSAAGQSSIADLAAADAHVVAVPEVRPFDEQDATAAHLEQLGLGAVVGREDSVADLIAAMRQTLERSRSTPGAGSGLRRAWEVDGAAQRLATVLESVAHGLGEDTLEMGVPAAATTAVGGGRR